MTRTRARALVEMLVEHKGEKNSNLELNWSPAEVMPNRAAQAQLFDFKLRLQHFIRVA